MYRFKPPSLLIKPRFPEIGQELQDGSVQLDKWRPKGGSGEDVVARRGTGHERGLRRHTLVSHRSALHFSDSVSIFEGQKLLFRVVRIDRRLRGRTQCGHVDRYRELDPASQRSSLTNMLAYGLSYAISRQQWDFHVQDATLSQDGPIGMDCWRSRLKQGEQRGDTMLQSNSGSLKITLGKQKTCPRGAMRDGEPAPGPQRSGEGGPGPPPIFRTRATVRHPCGDAAAHPGSLLLNICEFV